MRSVAVALSASHFVTAIGLTILFLFFLIFCIVRTTLMCAMKWSLFASPDKQKIKRKKRHRHQGWANNKFLNYFISLVMLALTLGGVPLSLFFHSYVGHLLKNKKIINKRKLLAHVCVRKNKKGGQSLILHMTGTYRPSFILYMFVGGVPVYVWSKTKRRMDSWFRELAHSKFLIFYLLLRYGPVLCGILSSLLLFLLFSCGPRPHISVTLRVGFHPVLA